jgi:RNA-directed DNA polymerase
VNTGEPWPSLETARSRVLEIQVKLHWRAGEDHARRFDDLYNLVADPAFLVVAWERVRGNRGARSAGVDGRTARAIEQSEGGVEGFLAELRRDLKARNFCPLPVRQRKIPKANGKVRSLGIPTVRDRVVQASLKLVLEPILEADFHPVSYGFRPQRRAQDAIEEIRMFAQNNYQWVFEGDIAACFDEIDHSALMGRLRRRVGDKRVLCLVKAFLKAGLLDEAGHDRETHTGTPQGGILSPLLANLALSALDDDFVEEWQRIGSTPTDRTWLRRHGLPSYRIVRYADDFVVLVHGTREQAECLWDRVAATLDTVGLKLAPDKTKVVHIDEGFDFLGFRIKRDVQRGGSKRYIYTYPSRKAVAAIMRKVKEATRLAINGTLADLLRHLNQVLRSWANHARHGASSNTFHYLGHYVWLRVGRWLRRKHPHRSWKWLRQRYTRNGWQPEEDGIALFNPATIKIVRYRYRGAAIPNPWLRPTTAPETPGLVESRMR